MSNQKSLQPHSSAQTKKPIFIKNAALFLSVIICFSFLLYVLGTSFNYYLFRLPEKFILFRFIVFLVYFNNLFLSWFLSLGIFTYLSCLLFSILIFGLVMFFSVSEKRLGIIKNPFLYFGFLGVILVALSPWLTDYSISQNDIMSANNQNSLIRVTSTLEKSNNPSERFQQVFRSWGESSCYITPVAWSQDSRYLLFGQRVKKNCGAVDTYTYDTNNQELKEGNYLSIAHGSDTPYIFEDEKSATLLKQYIDPELLTDGNKKMVYVKEALISPDQQKIAFTVAKGGRFYSPEDMFILDLSQDWKAFTSQEKGYQISYPASWYAYTRKIDALMEGGEKVDVISNRSYSPSELSLSNYSDPEFLEGPAFNDITINVVAFDRQEFSLDKFQQISPDGMGLKETQLSKDFNINGKKAAQVKGRGDNEYDMLYHIITAIETKEKLFIVTATMLPGSESFHEQKVDQIVDSFQEI